MKENRLWIEIVTLCAGVALALALLIATLGVAVVSLAQAPRPPRPAASAAPSQQTYEGMVTCSRCGAKHSPDLGKTAADCARVCVHGGAKFALVDGDRTYLLEGDLNVLKRIAGRRARIVGTVSDGTITISSVAAGT